MRAERRTEPSRTDVRNYTVHDQEDDDLVKTEDRQTVDDRLPLLVILVIYYIIIKGGTCPNSHSLIDDDDRQSPLQAHKSKPTTPSGDNDEMTWQEEDRDELRHADIQVEKRRASGDTRRTLIKLYRTSSLLVVIARSYKQSFPNVYHESALILIKYRKQWLRRHYNYNVSYNSLSAFPR